MIARGDRSITRSVEILSLRPVPGSLGTGIPRNFNPGDTGAEYASLSTQWRVGTDTSVGTMLATIVLWLHMALAYATPPSISNVTGTVQAGQTFTINGSNLLDENKTTWDAALQSNQNSFEGANPGADAWVVGEGSYTTSVKLFGSKSYTWSFSGSGNHQTVNYNDNLSRSVSEIWFRTYQRMDFVGGVYPDSHHKIALWYGTSNYDVNLNWRASSGPHSRLHLILNAEGSNVFSNVIPSGTVLTNKWHCIELKVPNGSPHKYEAWVDGIKVLDHNASSSPGASNWDFQFPVNLARATGTLAGQIWWDGMVLASSRVRCASIVEIGNSVDYATATKVYQYPEAISDTQVQVTADLSGLGAGPYYLWVTNNRGERSPTFSLSGATTIPAPGNLRVQ